MNPALADDNPTKDGGVTTYKIDFKLRAGHDSVAASGDRAAILGLIEQSNRGNRLDGLPDHLNPDVIDPQKAEAMIAALARLPAEMLRPLEGRALYLNSAGLMIGAAAPSRAASFAEPFGFEIADVQGDTVLARLTVRTDCPLAQQRAAEARARIAAANDEVGSLEAGLPAISGTDKEADALGALSAAKSRRFAIARAWRQNAEAWTKCASADPAAKADFEASLAAVKSYIVPPGSGMPN
jgi:hypothetical protein